MPIHSAGPDDAHHIGPASRSGKLGLHVTNLAPLATSVQFQHTSFSFLFPFPSYCVLVTVVGAKVLLVAIQVLLCPASKSPLHADAFHVCIL